LGSPLPIQIIWLGQFFLSAGGFMICYIDVLKLGGLQPSVMPAGAFG